MQSKIWPLPTATLKHPRVRASPGGRDQFVLLVRKTTPIYESLSILLSQK
jgi:hypothetical protein